MPNAMTDDVMSKPVLAPRPPTMRPRPLPAGLGGTMDDLRAPPPTSSGTPSNGSAGLSFGETEGDAYTALKAPAFPFTEAAETTEAHEEVGPEAGEAAEAFVEASEAQLAEAASAEAGEETAISDLTKEGYEATQPATEAPLREATATEGGQQEFAFLAALVPMLVSSVGPVLVKALQSKLSPRAKSVLTKLKATPPAAKPAGAGFGASSVLPLIAKLFAEASALSEGDGAGTGDEAAGEVVSESLVTEATAAIEAIVDYDDRTRITNTTATPWRRYCALRITFPSGATFRGTGFFIGPRAVATAGHCVYMQNQGGWARRVEVIPGCDGPTHPYGSATATEFRSTVGWVKNGLPAADYGCVFVPNGSFAGQNLGSFGVAAFDAATLLSRPVVVAGYPGDRPFAELWGASRLIKTVSAKTIGYDIATMPGESGAPVYIKLNGTRYVVGIHNYGAKTGNSATRVTQPVYARLSAWANA